MCYRSEHLMRGESTMEKRILCRECAGTIEVSGDVDETYGPDEVSQQVTCPFCSAVNEVMWPRSPSGWYVFGVYPVRDDDGKPH